jgi:S1-C subfamily serine protease
MAETDPQQPIAPIPGSAESASKEMGSQASAEPPSSASFPPRSGATDTGPNASSAADASAASTAGSVADPGSVSVNGWLVAILLLAVAAVMLRNAGLLRWPLWSAALPEPRVVQPRGNLAEDEQSTIELFKAASPCVVHIMGVAVRRDRVSRDVRIADGTGSGFVWDAQGHVVTNYHVIRTSNAANVTLADGSVWGARLIGYEPDQDLAVLKIDAPAAKLRPIPIGTSHDLQVGQKVFAIGNPFGLDQSLTSGVISGLGREIQSVSGRPIEGVVQTDAAINPGNSGGPLLDSAGRLIGINTAIASSTGDYSGVGFAVPVDTVNEIVPQLIQYGKVEQGGLGVSLLSDELAERLGVTSGAVVSNVLELSGAAEAGLLPIYRDRTGEVVFDVITAIDDQPVQRALDVRKLLSGRRAGDRVSVRVWRDGKELVLPITLQALRQGAR